MWLVGVVISGCGRWVLSLGGALMTISDQVY